MSRRALLAVVLWGASFVAAKYALAEMTPTHLVLLRMALAAMALDVALLWRRRLGSAARLSRRDWLRVALLVLLSVFVHQLAQMAGLRQTTAINSALLVTLGPLFMFLIAASLGQERVTWSKAAGFLAAVVGAAMVITRGQWAGLGLRTQTLAGDLLIVVSALGWALYSTLSMPLLRGQSATLVAALVFTLSVPLLSGVAALEGGSPAATLRGMTWRGWGALIFLAWLCSALGYVLWYGALQRRPVSQVSVLQYVQPAVAALLGVLILGETVAWTTAAGGVLILGGVALVNRRSTPPGPTTSGR